jgi:hypothetical protein
MNQTNQMDQTNQMEYECFNENTSNCNAQLNEEILDIFAIEIPKVNDQFFEKYGYKEYNKWISLINKGIVQRYCDKISNEITYILSEFSNWLFQNDYDYQIIKIEHYNNEYHNILLVYTYNYSKRRCITFPEQRQELKRHVEHLLNKDNTRICFDDASYLNRNTYCGKMCLKHMHVIDNHIDCKIFYDPIFIIKSDKLRYAKYIKIGKTDLGWILVEYDKQPTQIIESNVRI